MSAITHHELQLEPTITPLDFLDPIIQEATDGTIIVGFLAHDDDCQNPLENCDGMGSIHSFSRKHSNHKTPEEIQSGVADSVLRLTVLLSYFEHGQCRWGVAGTMSGMADFRWDGVGFAGMWVPDKSCLEHIHSTAIAAHLPPGVKVEYKSKRNPDGTCITRPCKPGERSYFKNPDGTDQGTVPDERYHNVITLTLPDGRERGGYASFTSAYRAAARSLGIKLTAETRQSGELAAARKAAQEACDAYTSWCNGECYGWVVAKFDADGYELDWDSCWGYVGDTKYLKEELAGNVTHELARCNALADATTIAATIP